MKLLPCRKVLLNSAKTKTDNHRKNYNFDQIIFSCKFKCHYKTPVFARK